MSIVDKGEVISTIRGKLSDKWHQPNSYCLIYICTKGISININTHNKWESISYNFESIEQLMVNSSTEKKRSLFKEISIFLLELSINQDNRVEKIKPIVVEIDVTWKLEKAIDDYKKNYLNEKNKVSIPVSAKNVKFKNGHVGITRGNNYIWIENNTLCLFPAEYIPSSENDRIKLFMISLDRIEYYNTRGEVVHENRISGGGGGGSSITGAIVGGVVAGGAGAIIGSRKKNEPVKSEFIKHDNRETFLNYFDDDNQKRSMLFEYKDVDVLNELMPSKAFEVVNMQKNVRAENIESTESVISQIEKIAQLRNDGFLTDDEFQEKKKLLLNKIS